MKILSSTKETAATEPNKFGCEFCKRTFVRESTMFKHICEYKHRWLEKDKQGNRIAFQSFLDFYKKNTASKKQKTYEEFIKSAYYTAFIKYGNYCVSIKCVNIPRYTDWLLKNQIKIDNWCQDTSYTKFLCEYLRVEDAFDALARSIETTIDLALEEQIQSRDYLRYGNINKICYQVSVGKISPWMLYHSDSGIKFLDKLNETQAKMIMDYINPELWAIKFKRESDTAEEIKRLLKQAGY